MRWWDRSSLPWRWSSSSSWPRCSICRDCCPVEPSGLGEAALAAFVWSALPATVAGLILAVVVWRTGALSWLAAAGVAIIAFAGSALLLPLELHDARPVLWRCSPEWCRLPFARCCCRPRSSPTERSQPNLGAERFLRPKPKRKVFHALVASNNALRRRHCGRRHADRCRRPHLHARRAGRKGYQSRQPVARHALLRSSRRVPGRRRPT